MHLPAKAYLLRQIKKVAQWPKARLPFHFSGLLLSKAFVSTDLLPQLRELDAFLPPVGGNPHFMYTCLMLLSQLVTWLL